MSSRGRPKAPAWTITRDHLPPHVQAHLPEDLDDTQLAFWWAAFSKGFEAAAATPRHTPDLDLGPTGAELQATMTTEANYGEPEPVVDERAERTALALRVAQANVTLDGIEPDRLLAALWADQALVDWRDGNDSTDPRILEAQVQRALEHAKLMRGDNW